MFIVTVGSKGKPHSLKTNLKSLNPQFKSSNNPLVDRLKDTDDLIGKDQQTVKLKVATVWSTVGAAS
jgi:hypothetical protein